MTVELQLIADPAAGQLAVQRGAEIRGARRVVRQRRAGAALFAEAARFDRERVGWIHPPLDSALHEVGCGGGVDVHRAALIRAHGRVAVGGKTVGAREHGHGAIGETFLSRERKFIGAAAAALRFDSERVAAELTAEKRDRAAERGIAEQPRAAALLDLDALERRDRQPAPIHPASERVVLRDAVEQHERAAGAVGADRAQAHALGRRIGDAAGGAPE